MSRSEAVYCVVVFMLPVAVAVAIAVAITIPFTIIIFTMKTIFAVV